MTHDDAIATLLAVAGGAMPPQRTLRAAAEAHVADCSDCWHALAELVREITGTLPADASAMAARYGCTDIRDELHRVVGVPAAAIEAEQPELARHLAWCLACRDRLAELEVVERMIAADARAAAAWSRTAAAGETVRAAAGRLVAHVREAAAGFVRVPEGFALGPVLAAPAALRGRPAREGGTPLHATASVPLADSGLVAELGIEPDGGDRVRLSVRVGGADAGPLSVQLHDARGGGSTAALARHTLRPEAPVVIPGIPAGSYLVDVRHRRDAQRFRLHFDVEQGG